MSLTQLQLRNLLAKLMSQGTATHQMVNVSPYTHTHGGVSDPVPSTDYDADIARIDAAIGSLNARLAEHLGIQEDTGTVSVVGYQYDSSIIQNPGRGREESYESDAGVGGGSGTLDDEGIASYANRVARRYWWCPTADAALPGSFLTGVEEDIDNAVAAGKLLNGKFAYFADDVTHLSKSRIDGHIAQLLPVLSARAYAFHSLEIGWFGRWGETHTINSAGWTDTTPGAGSQSLMKGVYETVAAGTPSTLWIGLRYPEVALWLINNGLSAGNQARMAIYNDGYMASTSSGAVRFDNGTFPGAWNDGYDVTRRDWLATFGLTHPVRGESDVDDAGVDDHFAQTSDSTLYYGLQRQHISVFRDWNPSTSLTTLVLNNKTISGETYADYYLRRLGYRMFLKQGRFPQTVAAGASYTFDLEIENMGVAAPMRSYVAKVKFGSSANTSAAAWVTATMNYVSTDANNVPTTIGAATNTQQWLGWQSLTQTTTTRWVRFTCTVPAGLSGNYPISLALIDPNSQLQSHVDYNIRLANASMWDSTNGRNNLLTTVAIT